MHISNVFMTILMEMKVLFLFISIYAYLYEHKDTNFERGGIFCQIFQIASANHFFMLALKMGHKSKITV